MFPRLNGCLKMAAALASAAAVTVVCAPAFGAQSLIPALNSHNFYGYGAAKVTDSAVKGEPFRTACTIVTRAGDKTPWASGAATPPSTIALKKGEHLKVSFYVRSVSPGSAQVEASYEQSNKPYQSSGRRTVTATKHWQKVTLPVVSAANYPASTTHVVFHTAFAKETIQIADVSVETGR